MRYADNKQINHHKHTQAQATFTKTKDNSNKYFDWSVLHSQVSTHCVGTTGNVLELSGTSSRSVMCFFPSFWHTSGFLHPPVIAQSSITTTITTAQNLSVCDPHQHTHTYTHINAHTLTRLCSRGGIQLELLCCLPKWLFSSAATMEGLM